LVIYFVDTCVFFAFATPFEPWHSKCVYFFEKDDEHRTGKRVIEEIDIRWRKRRKLYEDLSKSQASSGLFVPSVKMNPNDEAHIRELVSYIGKFPKEQTLSILRDMRLIIRKGLEKAKNEITQPFIGVHYDDVCYAIQAYIQNQNDAEILTDALCWSEEDSPTIFCTLDYHDIIRNRSKIVQVICNSRFCSEEDIPMQIKHVSEIIG